MVENNSAVIVIHGIDYNANGRYDYVLGGDREHHVPFEETAPALCGVLKRQGPVRTAAASAPQTYTATLVRAPAPPSAPTLLCDLRHLSGRLL
jgi:hypothetical protein